MDVLLEKLKRESHGIQPLTEKVQSLKRGHLVTNKGNVCFMGQIPFFTSNSRSIPIACEGVTTLE